MNRAFLLSFDGTDFYGWQMQKGRTTVQQVLNVELSRIFKKEVRVIGCSRTDAGVHARQYLFSFIDHDRISIPHDNLQRVLNRRLPPSIHIQDIAEMPESFHPQFDVLQKTYLYRLTQKNKESPFKQRYISEMTYPLSFDKIAQATSFFLGKHDFKHIALLSGKEKNTLRTIDAIHIDKKGSEWSFFISGQGFLHHMVRRIVGILVDVGRGHYTVQDVDLFFENKRNKKAVSRTMPAKGLTLYSLLYPKEKDPFFYFYKYK